MDKISPQDIALFKNVTLQDDNTAKTFIFRYSNVDTAIFRYFESQEPESSNSTTVQTNNNSAGPSTNSNTFLQARSSLPKNEFSRPSTEPTTAPTTEKKPIPRETINIDDDSLDEDFDPNRSDELDEPAQDPFEKIKSTLFSAIQSGVNRMLNDNMSNRMLSDNVNNRLLNDNVSNRMLNDNVSEFIAITGATEAIAKTYLARYGSTARALDEYFVRDTGEDQIVANNNSNSIPFRATVTNVPQMQFPTMMNFMNREPVKHQRKSKVRSEHSALALRLRGNYDAYVKNHLKDDLAEEWPKFLGSLLVECRINTQEMLSKVKVRDEVHFEPEEVEYTSTNITKKQKNSEGIATKVVVGKNWYIKGASLLVRCIWKGQFVGYLNCEYEEAFVFLLSKKYIFVEGVIVDCPEVSKNGEFSVHGNNQFRGFSGFNKIKVQLDVFMTEQVITNPLNIVAIPGRRRGGVKSTRSAKTQEDEIEDSKEAQQMYQMLRLAKESFVKLFKMLELKVTIPTVVQVRHRIDPFQRIKREKYGFKARGRGRYFMNSSGSAAEVLTEDFKDYYKSPKSGENGNGVNRAQTLNRINNGDLNSEDDEDEDDFDDDLIEEYEDDDMDSDDSDRPRMRRMNTMQPSMRRMSTQVEDSKGQNENSKQNQDLFGGSNQISSYYKATEPPETLKSTLHLYQKQALSWMQYREGLMEREELFETKLEEHRLLNDLFQEMTLLDGSKVYFNPFNGEISVDFPTLKACKGGILADEMGLGKTVMTIALIHAHNRKTLKQKKLEVDEESEEEEDESEDSDESEEEDEDEDLEVKPKPKRARRGKARQAKKKPLKGTLDNFVKVKRIPAMNKKRQAENDLDSDDEGDVVDDKEKDEDFEVSEIVTSKKKLKMDNKKGKNVGKKGANAAKKPTPSKAKASQSKDNKGKGTKKEKGPRVIQGGTLIVLPLTVLSQWEDEIKKHSKGNTLSVLQYYGGGREKHNLEDYDVVLTTYGTLETECSKQQKDTPSVLFDCQWFRVILDEAHYIKGRTTKTTKAACSLQAEYRWCLTGTPLQNRLDDMFSLMQFLKVDTWGEYFWWNTYINKYTSHDEAANLIRGILKPLILRRTKKSTYLNGSNILDLPGKEIKSHFVKLTHEERAIYNCFFQGSKQQFNDLVANGSIQYEYAHIFELLIRLRQVCDHPSLVFSKDDLKNKESLETAVYKFLEKRMPIGGTMPQSNKQDILKKMLTGPKEGEGAGEEKMEEENSNSMMQSEFIQKTLERLKNKELEPCCICLEEITDPAIAKCGHIFCKACLTLSLNNSKKCPLCQNEISLKDVMSISLEDQDRCRDLLDSNAANFKKSSKLAAVIDAVHEVAKKGEKVVIFSQFIGMLNLIERFFKEENVEYRRIDGSSTMKERARRIDDFNQEKKVTAFLISLKAGAIGLNLTVATNVFLVDPWWNPAIEDQAIERVHRIGQKSEVNVVRFVCEKTIEERIQQLNAQKKDMINKILQFNPQEQKKQNLDNMIYVMRGFDDE